MSILIKSVRISGFRGLENIEVFLENTTILTGMNNSGKTSFLKSLQLALGNRQFITQDDFSIHENSVSEKIIVDLLIEPINADGSKCENFSGDWEILFTTDRIKTDDLGNSSIPFRTLVTYDEIKNSYKSQQFILQSWPEFKQESVNWFDAENGKKTNFHFDEMPFFYIDAQRDILEDIKLRTSYIGKMLSKIEYPPEAIKEIEDQIKSLNEKAVDSSDVLSNIKETLKELDTAMDTRSDGIEITPFTKKIRDLNKGLTIYYTDQQDSFPMEYHGMGTRSWSSLLTLKSFISLLSINAEKNSSVFFPIIAVEEPESHLHPNAQKKLYRQIDNIVGQKIISTHSPYIAAAAELRQIRSFYKHKPVICGQVDMDTLSGEDIRKINRQVINTRGEIFFSKVIVFFEGETEEQALPILAQKHFNMSPAEMGLDFVGVGGHGNYLPFLRFAEALNIPWVIFSDAEEEVITSVKKQISNCGSAKAEGDNVVFLDTNNDFEGQLISDGFQDEIKKAIIQQCEFSNDQHMQEKTTEINDYTDDELNEILTGGKTQFGPAVAAEIVNSTKTLPPKVIKLFGIVATLSNMQETGK